jgi:hypothetical protein
VFYRKHTELLSGVLYISPDSSFTDHIPTHLQCLRVCCVGLDDVNIFPRNFSSDLQLGGRFVAYETKDDIIGVFRELSEELKLHD